MSALLNSIQPDPTKPPEKFLRLRMHEICEERGWTFIKMARELKVSAAIIVFWNQGKRLPPFPKLIYICKTLEIWDIRKLVGVGEPGQDIPDLAPVTRGRIGRKKKFKPEEVVEMRRMYWTEEASLGDIALLHSVTHTSIYRIVNRLAYADVEDPYR